MASKEFVPVSITPGELIDEDTLAQMNNNITYLRDQMVDGIFQHTNGGGTSTGIKILAGRIAIKPRAGDDARAKVKFLRMFTPGCQPIVTTSVTSTHQPNIFVTIEGDGQVHPDHNGFVGIVNIAAEKKKQDKIARKIYINWIAVGY
jgi:hypothetical protein